MPAPTDPNPGPAPEDVATEPRILESHDPRLATARLAHFHGEVGDTPRTLTSPGRAIPPPPLPEGTPAHPSIPAHDFDLQRLIARGGMGEVWQAMQISLERTVAVKRVREDVTHASHKERLQLEASFLREALISAQLEHPNIVPVHDLGRDASGAPVLAMKYVQGTRWDILIREDFPILTVDEFLNRHLPILIDVAHAVAFAHSRNIIHRDIKPSQVMVGEYGEVQLMDWGLAVYCGPTVPDTPSLLGGLPLLESASSPSGTPALMAPEQTDESALNNGPWTDIYLLGGTLYFLLSGTFPHDAQSQELAVRHAREGDVDDPRDRATSREVPEDLAALALRCLAPDRHDRPRTAMDVARAIQGYLTGASKRNESLAITAEIESLIPGAKGDYKVIGELIGRSAEARALWARNPAVSGQRRRLFAMWVEAAIANRDLVLARVQLERMGDCPEKAVLRARIATAEEELARRENVRRTTVGLSVVAVLALVAGAVFFVINTFNAKSEAETLRERAESDRLEAVLSRRESEALVQFMLRQVAHRGSWSQPVPPVTTEVLDRAYRHYLLQVSNPTAGDDDGSVCEQLLLLADLYTEIGNHEGAASSAAASVAYAKARITNAAGALPWRRRAGDALIVESDAFQRIGESDIATDRAHEAYKLLIQLPITGVHETEDHLRACDAAALLMRHHIASGSYDRALQVLYATESVMGLARMEPENSTHLLLRIARMRLLGVEVLTRQQRFQEAFHMFETIVAIVPGTGQNCMNPGNLEGLRQADPERFDAVADAILLSSEQPFVGW